MSSPNQPTRFHVGLLLSLYGRVLKSYSFIVILLLGLGATGVLGYISRPVFRSEAVLVYQERSSANPVGLQREAPSPRRIGLTLQETLFSRALLEKLITDFGLYTKVVARYGIGAGIEEMQKKDLHFTVREGYTFRIAYDAKSPDLAQAVVQAATALLLQSRVDAQAQEAKEIQAFLDSEKGRAEEDLRKREAALTLLIAQHPEVVDITPDRGGSAPVDTSSLGYEMQAVQLREKMEQARRRSVGTSESGRPLVPGDGNDVRARAEAEVVAAQRDLAEKQAMFTEEYPDVKRAAMRLATAKAYLRRVEANPPAAPANPGAPRAPGKAPTSPAGNEHSEVKFLEEQLKLVEKQVRSARSLSRRSQPRSGTLTDPEALAKVRAQYIELERRVRESRDHLALLANRHFQVEMQAVFASQGKQDDLVVVDPAFKPVAPLRSKRPKIVVIGGLSSLVLALGMGLFLTLRDDRLRGPADLLRFGLPTLLAEVPAAENEPDA